jgi:lysophospholipase L1-like esterase
MRLPFPIIAIGGRGGSSGPTQSLQYTSRSGLNLLETKSGNSFHANIMPIVGKIDANNYASLNTAGFAGSDASGYIEVEMYYNGDAEQNILLFTSADAATQSHFVELYLFYGYITLDIKGAVGGAFENILRYQLPIGAAWYKFRLTSNGSAYSLLVNDVSQTLAVVSGLNNGKWFDKVANRDNVCIGAFLKSVQVKCTTTSYVTYVIYSTTNKWILTGFGTKVFDIIGGLHMGWTGTAHADFKGIDSHCLNIGYSIWQKTGSYDEYVPYSAANTPYDASAALVGYIKYRDYPGSVTEYNLFPSLIGFNESGSLDVKLEIFDRSNITRQTAASRAGIFYDTTSLATKCRYYCSATASPFVSEFGYDVFKTFFNTGYKKRIIEARNLVPFTSITGINIYDSDLSDNNLATVLESCKVLRFLAFGDSITSGPSSTTRYSYYVSNAMAVPEINSGVPSDAVQIELVARINDILVYEKNTRVFILCGINDIDHLVNDSPQGTDAAFIAAYESIIDSLVGYGYLKVNIYISTLTWLAGDSYGYRDHVIPYNTLISNIATNKGVNLIDLYAVTLNQATYYTGAEELHPNAIGHSAMAIAIENAITW